MAKQRLGHALGRARPVPLAHSGSCVGDGGRGERSAATERRAAKPGELVASDAELSVRERAPYVSRGGIKLANAWMRFELAVQGVAPWTWAPPRAASPTACSRAGLREVIAVDVGYGDFDYKLRQRSARDRAGAHERSFADARNAALRRPSWLVDRRLVHLAAQGPAGAVLGCLAARYDVLAWSSHSSRWGASVSARVGWCAPRKIGARR